METGAHRSRVSGIPKVFFAKNGNTLLISTLNDDRCRRLLRMYLAFRPRNSFQGLPPLLDDRCRAWVQQMISTGINLVALDADDEVVGHCALFPIDNRVCELFVAVSPPLQNSGIGTELVRCAIRAAQELGFERIWLPVEPSNLQARRIYRKIGFEYLADVHCNDMEMILDISSGWRHKYIEHLQAT